MKKKFVITLVVAMTFAGLLAGCGRTQEPETEVSSGDEAAGTGSPGAAAGSPAVYMTTDISSDGLITVYEALQASPEGKAHIHSGGTGGSMWGGDQDAFLESMAEAGKSVVDYLDGNILYINVMNRLSVDCDCDGNPAEPDMHDIGILASYDPVALDQACVDLVYSARDGDSMVERIESRNGLHTLEHAEEIGLGSRTYELINIEG